MRCGLSKRGRKASAPAPAPALCTHTTFSQGLELTSAFMPHDNCCAYVYPSLFMERKKCFWFLGCCLYISLAATVLAYGNVYLRNCRVGKRRDFRIQKSRLLNQATDPIMIEKRRGGNVLMLVPLSSWRLKRWRNNLDEIEIDRVSTYILDRDSAVCMLLKMISFWVLFPFLFSSIISCWWLLCHMLYSWGCAWSSIRRERLDSLISRRLIIIRNLKDKKKRQRAQLNQLGFCSWLHSVTDATERERGGGKEFRPRSIISPTPHKARMVFLDRMLMTYWLPSSSSRLH